MNVLFSKAAWFDARRWAILLWTILTLFVTIRVAVQQPNRGTVWFDYVDAGHDWLAGEDLYSINNAKPIYRYHPVLAVFFVPATFVPEKLGGILWRWLGIALLWCAMRAWTRKLPGDGWPAMVWLTPLVLPSVNNGQINVHLTATFLRGTAAFVEHRWTRSAAWIGAATLAKLYPISLGLLLALQVPRRFGMRFLGVLVVGSMIPFLCQRPVYVAAQYQLWHTYLQADDRHVGVETARIAPIEQPRDAMMLWKVLGGSMTPEQWPMVEGVAALICAAIALGFRRLAPEHWALLVMHLSVVWMTAFGPSTESSTYTLVGPTAALLVTTMAGRLRWLAFAGTLLLLLPTLALLVPDGKQVQMYAPQPAGALLLGVAAVVQVLRKRDQRRSFQ